MTYYYSDGNTVRYWNKGLNQFTSTANCQISGTSFSISSTGSSSTNTACGLTLSATKYFNGSEVYPTLADIIYNESSLSSTFNGGNNYFKINNDLALQISSNGTVLDVYDCSAQGNQ